MSKKDELNCNGVIEKKLTKPENPEQISTETLFAEIVGEFGWWQASFCLFFILAAIASCFNSLMLVFIAPNVDFWCTDGGGIESSIANNDNAHNGNDTGDLVWAIGTNHSVHTGDQCWITVNGFRSQPCTKWSYDVGLPDSPYQSTIISEWDLVCNKSWLVSFSQSIYMIGVVVTQFIMSHFSDKFGRKPIILGNVCVSVVSSFSCAFSTSITQFLLSRFFLAFGNGATWSTCFVLLNEIVGAKYRDLFSYMIQIGWAIGYMLLPAIANYAPDYRQIVLVCSVIQASQVFFLFSMPESPRWLLVNGQIDRAFQAIRNAAKINNRLSEPNFEQNISKLENYYRKLQQQQSFDKKVSKQYTILDLFCTWNIARMTTLIYFIWIINNLVYYGLSINTNDLAGNPTLNFVLMGAVEIPAYICCILMAKRIGNRISILWMMIGAGIGCLLTMTLQSNYYLGIVGALFGKFCITCSFSIIFVFSTQIYPTVFRTIGLGTSSMAGKFGSAIAPFIKELSQLTHMNVSFSLLGILSIVSGLCILLIPASKNDELPDRPEDIESNKT